MLVRISSSSPLFQWSVLFFFPHSKQWYRDIKLLKFYFIKEFYFNFRYFWTILILYTWPALINRLLGHMDNVLFFYLLIFLSLIPSIFNLLSWQGTWQVIRYEHIVIFILKNSSDYLKVFSNDLVFPFLFSEHL